MKFKIFILLYLSLLSSCSEDDHSNGFQDIEGNISFVKTIGGSNNDSAESVIATQDGGYAILGYTQSTNGDVVNKTNESFDFWILKYDQNNELQWQKTYGGSGDDRGNSIIETSDNGYAVIGYTQSNDGDVLANNGFQDFWLLKLDHSGNIIWQKSYGFSGLDSGISIIETSDQGYLLAGILDVTASNGEGNSSRLTKHAGGDYWILKLDLLGNLQWSQYFGGNFSDTPEGMIETVEGDFIIAGGSDSEDTDISNPIGLYDFWILKLSAQGELIWEKSFGGEHIDEARAIVEASDGNFIIAGDTRSDDTDVSANHGNADAWIIKISSEGNLIWERNLGGTSFDVARAIIASKTGGFILAGSSRSSDIDVSENKGQNDAWIIKVNNAGAIEWQNTIGGTNIDFAYSLAELKDNTVICVGNTTSNDGDILENKGFTDALLIKLD